MRDSKIFQGGRGHWAVYYTFPQSFIIKILIHWLSNFGDFYWILIGWFSIQTFKLLIKIHRRGNFVYHHGGCTSIYRLLSYPFRSFVKYSVLNMTAFLNKIYSNKDNNILVAFTDICTLGRGWNSIIKS